MQNVTNFINLLGENYYLDFIIEPYAEEVDFEKYYLLVEYQNKYFYELQLDLIKIKQSDIVNKAKEIYKKSLSDLYLEVSKLNKGEIEKLLNFHVQAIKLNLKTLKDDFYIYENKSRYFSILIDQYETICFDRKRKKEDLIDVFDFGSEMYSVFRRIDPNDYLYNIEDTDSIYNIEVHCNRQICLSILPFKLFEIGKQFIFELEKIKSMNNEDFKNDTTNSLSQSNKKDTYFDKFCELIDDYTILKKSTAIGVMVDLEDCIKRIKSETLLELQEKGINRNDHLDFKINEIEKQNYLKDANISYIQKWLDEYEISIEDILCRNYRNNNIEAFIDRHYNDMDKNSPEKDKALLVQTDFYFYFCKLYADELIAYFNSKKDNKETTISTKQTLPMKPFKDEYLTAFCKEISNEREIYQSPFIQCYDYGIKNFTEYLKSEINENLLILPSDKITPYIDFIEDKIKNTPYFEVNNTILDKWIKKYNLQNLEFPFIENKEVKQLISLSVNFHHLTEEEKNLMEDIQIDFYGYAAMIEAKKIIDHIESKKSNSNNTSNKIENTPKEENTNQLSVNQAIILLDRLGFFSSATIENLPNTKKAKLISQMLGKNEKNIKTAIEKLETKPSKLNPNYQNDIDKVERILNNLE